MRMSTDLSMTERWVGEVVNRLAAEFAGATSTSVINDMVAVAERETAGRIAAEARRDVAYLLAHHRLKQQIEVGSALTCRDQRGAA